MSRTVTPPQFVPPQLATLVGVAPEGDAWIHEVKFDGYRLECLVHGAQVRLLTRSGADWTSRFPGVARWLAGRGWRGTILDGEVVVLDARGRSSFQQLQGRLSEAAAEGVVYFAFDLLQHEGRSLREAALLQRKAALKRLLARISSGAPVRYSAHQVGHGGRIFSAGCRQGLEGIIAKRADAPYESGRSRSWVKVKCVLRQEFVVIGYTPPKGSRERIGALLVATHTERGPLRYAGRVGSGFSGVLLQQLEQRLRRVARSRAPLSPAPPAPTGTVWVAPEVVVEVQFTEWTADGLLRHPSFLGVREDKMASQVKRETPAGNGVVLTHPDKVLYPEQGLTKQDLARYYTMVARFILPHVVGRPLSLVRCPAGRAGSCFYQKHLTGAFPEALGQVTIRQSDGPQPYAVVEDLDGLVALVQIGALEIHHWGARADRVDAPDRMVFDLDPGKGVTWKALCDAAGEVRAMLADVGLESWVKTSGGKGIHVVAPIERRSTWDQVSGFSRAVAQTLEQHAPDRFLSRAAKAERSGRIFIDWLRNTRGATAVAAWSTRARPGAPVSLPCDWARLSGLGRADAVGVAAVLADGLPYRTDPWRALPTTRQRLPTRFG